MSKYTVEIEKIIARAEEDGFQRGWQAARDALNSSVPSARVAGVALASKPKAKRRKGKRAKSKASGPTVEQRVLDFIISNPGNTGAGVIRGLGDANPRTVRTMFRRLRKAEKIEKKGDGWFKK